jgi:uncharacterized membrane protein HdeD (DUF308 family)
LSILLGLFLVLRPATGALAMVAWIGLWAVIFGIVTIALAMRLRLSTRPMPPAVAH